jgi:outer membrane protein TolC
MSWLTTWQNVLPALCCVIFYSGIAQAGAETTDATVDKNQAIKPLTIDDKYSQNAIQAKTGQGLLTLHGAVQEANDHNREVLEARLQVSRFKWDYISKETDRLPNVRLISYLAQQTATNQAPVVPPRANAFVFLSALFPVTQQYRIGLEAKAIKLAKEIAAQRLRQRIDDTRALVKEAYYKLALDESLLEDTEDSVKYLSDLKKTVSDQVKQGNSLKVEEMEVNARLAKARFDETKAKNSYTIDRETFNHLLGRELKSGIKLELIPPVDELDLNLAEAEQRALSMRPEIQEADMRVRQLRLEKKILISEYIPNVSIGVVYITLPGFNNEFIPKNLLAPGIFINWNAFDWGRKAFRAKALSKVEQGARLTSESSREEVLIDLHKQINKLNESRQLVETAQIARAAAKERMRVSLNRYKFTAEKLDDVLQAQSRLSNENNNYHEALLAFWGSRAQVERAEGLEQ